jgi:predicted metal-dependent phosphoesterase TrpH
VELSTVWSKRSVHVVGLNIDTSAAAMVQALASQREIRYQRARHIGEKLARQGFKGAYEGALVLAGDSAPCRPHFASWLVAQGKCKDGKQAFDRFLGNSKMTGINHAWPRLDEAVAWIVAAGGVAVLAHPEDYRLTRSKLRLLLTDFVAAGGQAMELVAPGKPEAVAQMIATLCREFELRASVGSDYHGGSRGWRHLGKTRAIPADLSPVWELF